MNAADAFFGIFGMTRVEEPLKLTTTIDVTLGRGQNMREHYRVRANRVKWDGSTMASHMTDDRGARVTLMRPIARIPLDTDNLSGAFKGVRDEVAAFLGVDDKSERIHWVYTQEKGKGLKSTITIEVLPVADIDPQVKQIRELKEQIERTRFRSDVLYSCLRRWVEEGVQPLEAKRLLAVTEQVEDPQVKRVRELEAMLDRWVTFGVVALGTAEEHDIVTSTRRLLGMVTT
jgi:hypothetical protein